MDIVYSELNMLQIAKRKRGLEPNEIIRLNEINQQFQGDSRILTGVYILLQNYQMANFHFKNICAKEKELFRNSPIMNLWEEFTD